MKLKYFLFILFIVSAVAPAVGQHHYKGVESFEINSGSRLSGTDFDLQANIFYSKYINYRSYYKIGFTYFETDILLAKKYEHAMYNYLAEGRYSYTLIPLPNFLGSSDFFFSLQGGVFGGIERLSGLGKYRDANNIPYITFPDYHRNTFVVGGTVTAEFELFLSKRVALLIDVSEYWTPLSDVEKWHTTASVGFKFLIY